MNNPHDFQRIPEILGSQESHFVYKSKSNATAVLVGGGIGMVAILVSRDPESNPRMQKRSNCQTITFSKVITFFCVDTTFSGILGQYLNSASYLAVTSNGGNR